MDKDLLYGIILISASIVLFYICIKELLQEHEKFDMNDFSQAMLIKGFLGALLLLVCGLAKVFGFI
jgi:hypothetical protein